MNEPRDAKISEAIADALWRAADEFEPEHVGDMHLASRVVHKLHYLAAMARSGDWPEDDQP